MKLRTEISPPPSRLKIGYDTTVLTLGSCFSEEIGRLLVQQKFKVLNNPFGTAFNPISIAEILHNTYSTSQTPALPCQLNDVYLDHRFHSSLFGYSKEELNNKITQAFLQSKQQLENKPSVLVITLGTAWIYRHRASNRVVSNCHKQDPKGFLKELGSIDDFKTALQPVLQELLSRFPHLDILLTVSPVRHTKEGLSENQLSKSILRVLCHNLQDQQERIHYFPAYEILIDDLRDYRFYNTDLIHPNNQAIEYIWNIFRNTFFEASTEALIKQWSALQHKLAHKPFYDQSQSYLQFLQQTHQELKQLSRQLPLNDELNTLEKQIQDFQKHV